MGHQHLSWHISKLARQTNLQSGYCMSSHESGILHLVLLGCMLSYRKDLGIFSKEDWHPQTVNLTGDCHLTV